MTESEVGHQCLPAMLTCNACAALTEFSRSVASVSLFSRSRLSISMRWSSLVLVKPVMISNFASISDRCRWRSALSSASRSASVLESSLSDSSLWAVAACGGESGWVTRDALPHR